MSWWPAWAIYIAFFLNDFGTNILLPRKIMFSSVHVVSDSSCRTLQCKQFFCLKGCPGEVGHANARL